MPSRTLYDVIAETVVRRGRYLPDELSQSRHQVDLGCGSPYSTIAPLVCGCCHCIDLSGCHFLFLLPSSCSERAEASPRKNRYRNSAECERLCDLQVLPGAYSFQD